MRYVVIAVLALVLGAFAARSYYLEEEEPVDPINVMVLQMKTHADHRARAAGGGVVSRLSRRRRYRSGDLHRVAGEAVLRAGAG